MATQAREVRNTRRVRPADRREQILAAAARLFAEYGFEATSVRQIADAVKMLPGSLYHHFDTKEDILHAILRAPLQAVAERRTNDAADGDAEQRLIATVVSRFQDAVTNWEVNTILLNDSAFFRRRPEFAYVLEMKSASFALQESIILDGMRAGLFRADIDVYMMIATIARMLSSAAEWFRTQDFFSSRNPADYTLDRVVNFHVDCVLRLVRAPQRLESPVSLNLCHREPL
jgi:TetR/AcrR family transcriptional regulator, cholesterol catabolism regulator